MQVHQLKEMHYSCGDTDDTDSVGGYACVKAEGV